mmetsp:Transcript_49095/g.128151  ORF Transcript_49095/g.128151 Transcript_49095/m.128151 type:complete len:246 (+) Transcript_49095:565-1302(+)
MLFPRSHETSAAAGTFSKAARSSFHCFCCASSNSSCWWMWSRSPLAKSELVVLWKSAASTEMARLISSHLLWHSSSTRSASVTFAWSLAPLPGSSAEKNLLNMLGLLAPEPVLPSSAAALEALSALATCHFCRSFVRVSRSCAALENSSWAWSRFLRTSLSDDAIPELNVSSAESPDTCSACTCFRKSSRSASRDVAMCVNGRLSSRSDCESRSKAGPRWLRSPADSASVDTVAWCAASAAVTTV